MKETAVMIAVAIAFLAVVVLGYLTIGAGVGEYKLHTAPGYAQLVEEIKTSPVKCIWVPDAFGPQLDCGGKIDKWNAQLHDVLVAGGLYQECYWHSVKPGSGIRGSRRQDRANIEISVVDWCWAGRLVPNFN